MGGTSTGSYTYEELRAAAQIGYSRGFSARKRGTRVGRGTVVHLAEWLEARLGTVSAPSRMTPEQWVAGRAGMPCIVNPEQSCIGRGLCLQKEAT
jgi:hypothetical protein